MLITIPVIGYISDFIDRKIIYFGGLTLLFVLAIPYFTMIGRGVGWFYMMQAVVLGVIWGAIFSTQGTLFSELFPAKVRYTGLSVLSGRVSLQVSGPLIYHHGGIIWPIPLVFGDL
jgi:MFS family permease